MMNGSDGTTWKDMDATFLAMTNFTPTANESVLLSGNADLWTTTAGVNQDIGIFISGGAFGTGQIVGWKESGGFAGTYSPNAAYVQTVVQLTAGTAYTIKLQWKTNKATTATIVAAAGNWPNFSPTRLTMHLFTRREIVRQKVCEQFDIDPEQAQTDAEQFVSELSQHGILLVSDHPLDNPQTPGPR